jgi:hypothetical protein
MAERLAYDCEDEERHHIICGNCRDLHETVAEVRECYAT